ncbi:acetylxylan esterase [Muriicola sp. Z0-33]|uniref:glucuronyl esterase domain-containing protein n=1 Tax=Muriicola sp. Z0-33 TaxID=2816957 RepID=UPI0022385D4A|nr:acetylxylan esterase [Muriicola sp. Z0-33]MCW5517746.1 acetylxylan esterase [Muriicola sp. Z0-33]
MTLLTQHNTDESLVPEYDLPALLTDSHGKQISEATTWEEHRRSEILSIFEQEVYGIPPLEEIAVEVSEKVLERMAFHGKATIREITFTFTNNGKRLDAVLLLVLPNSPDPAAVFLGYNFGGNHTILPDESIQLPKGWVLGGPQIGAFDHKASVVSRGAKYSRWPVLNMLARGYGLATMHYGDIDPDFDDDFKNGIHALFSNSEHIKNGNWGALATWSWGLSKIMDYFETNPLINHEKITLLGHSRLGKAALWAGALDKRFAIVISNNSGCGGAALSKRRFGETVAAINKNFPHWFCKNFEKYNENESAMPFDQHQLLALMAPRPLYIASAQNDSWADPKGEFLSLKHASAVYALYHPNSTISGELPEVNRPLIQGKLGYHIRTGNHDVTPYDWEQFMNFTDQHFANGN